MKKNIFLVPRLNNAGGVAKFYSIIKENLVQKFQFLYRGKDGNESDVRRFVSDYFIFCKELILSRNIKCIIINSSLGKGGFIRDSIYMHLNRLLGRKNILLFFHGWNPNFEKKIDKSRLIKKWLKISFLKAEHIIVLSSNFRDKLKEWGYEGNISIVTTLVDEKLVEDIDIKLKKFNDPREINLLYLGNVSKSKGLRDLIRSFHYIHEKNKYNLLGYTIAGSGEELQEMKKYSEQNGIPVSFPGYVIGEQKKIIFSKATLYIFASYHEGMPLSVLEAMAFGLPVLTTRVGGIPDFFEEGKMGLFLDNRDPEHIAEKIEYLLDSPELMKEMSIYNYKYAKKHFYASKVAARLERIIDDVAEGSV